MSDIPAAVLDSSALLAYLLGEPGADTVQAALAESAAISAVNYAEVLSKLSDLGRDADSAAGEIEQSGLTRGALRILPVDEALAREIARLRPISRHLGLSLGDRTCLALGRALRVPVLTGDRAWMEPKLRVKVRLIR